jgi:hypothetical protein
MWICFIVHILQQWVFNFIFFKKKGELFMPFNKSIIIHVPIRLEAYRFSPQEFKNFIFNLQRISKNPRNIIAANNYFDLEYIKYFTGFYIFFYYSNKKVKKNFIFKKKKKKE